MLLCAYTISSHRACLTRLLTVQHAALPQTANGRHLPAAVGSLPPLSRVKI